MNERNGRKSRSLKAGFTLIELMVVLVIIGLLAGFVGPKIMSAPEKARVTKAQNDIKAIESALRTYKLDNGNYPTTEQGLRALVEKPEVDPIPANYQPGGYLDSKEVPKDPWNRDYIYRSPSEIEDEEYDLITLGADGLEGGEGYDTDISSYSLKGGK